MKIILKVNIVAAKIIQIRNVIKKYKILNKINYNNQMIMK